jgi:hypothetical protein
MPSIAGGKIQRVANPILLWESLARPGDRRATTMPADVTNKKPQVGDPLGFEVAKGTVAIGRVDGDVQIDDQTISRVHCTLQQDPKTEIWTVVDMGSSNGTFVRGDRLKPNVPFELSDDETMVLGSASVRFLSPNGFYAYLDAVKRAAAG